MLICFCAIYCFCAIHIQYFAAAAKGRTSCMAEIPTPESQASDARASASRVPCVHNQGEPLHLSNTTCPTRVFFKSVEYYSSLW